MSEKDELIQKVSKTSYMPHTSPINMKNYLTNIQFTLKPHKFNLAKDIVVKTIYQSMIKEANSQIKRIEINRLMKHNRRQIIIKMKDFIVQNKLSSYILFNAIYYLDILLSTKTKINIDKLGIGALILSSKFNELNLKNPYMKEYGYIYGNYFSSINDLLQIEIICLKKLNYCLNYIQPIHFLQLLLINGIVFSTDNNKAVSNSIHPEIYDLPYQVLEIAIANIEYRNYSSLHIACSCIAITRETYHFEKWNGFLEKIFQVKFSTYEVAYNFVKSTYDSILLNSRQRRSLLDINNDTIFKESRAASGSHIQSSEKTFKFKSNYDTFQSKSLEKENKRYNYLLGQRSKIEKRIKVSSSKSIQEETKSIINVSELNHHKYRNRRLGIQSNSNFFSKAINKSCAINSGFEKDEMKYLNKQLKNKEDGNSPEKKKNLMLNSVIGKHVDLTSLIYTSLLRSNKNLNLYTTHKRRISVEEKKGPNASCPYTRRGKRNSSLTRGSFNYCDLYKDKTNKNSSISSIRSKNQCV